MRVQDLFQFSFGQVGWGDFVIRSDPVRQLDGAADCSHVIFFIVLLERALAQVSVGFAPEIAGKRLALFQAVASTTRKRHHINSH